MSEEEESIKKWGIIDINGGIGGLISLKNEYNDQMEILLSTEGDVLKSCVFLHKYPESPLLPVSLQESTIEAIFNEIETLLVNHQNSHRCLVYYKTANYFYYLWTTTNKPETNELFKRELSSLNWIILACVQWKSQNLIQKWVIETESRLYQALPQKVKDMVFSQEYNQVSFGIPQNKKLCLLVETPMFIHTNVHDVQSWAQMLDMPPKETMMFSSRYSQGDIVKLAKLGRVPNMEIRTGFEVPFEFLSSDECLISMGNEENFALAPLTAGQIGVLYGFPLDYLDVSFILEKEKRNLILTSKWPKVCRKILESFCGLKAMEKTSKQEEEKEEQQQQKNEERDKTTILPEFLEMDTKND